MIFISQSGITDATRAADWDRWYLEHLRIMATVPGIASAQRFKTDMPGFPPSLAIYSVASPAVFNDPYYLSVRGMGEWLALIDRQHYKRNLFDGLEHAPIVADGAYLLVADRARAEGAISGIEFTWLKSVALDRSTPYRGLAVAKSMPAFDATVAVYRPATPRMTLATT
ncbi:MAG TPA: hypothetical protein VGQ88_06475 [Burkholderiales bacterium]|nr:hypothetical protein [Burkholderiales bacterium]